MGARNRLFCGSGRHYNKMRGKAKVKTRGFDRTVGLWIAALMLFSQTGNAFGLEVGRGKTEKAPKEEASQITPEQLNAMKAEWEDVREQQIQMIRDKEEQLEKIKEELFEKSRAAERGPKTPAGGAAPEQKVVTATAARAGTSGVREDLSEERKEFELQKEAFVAERQKFFLEMNRQKEKLRELQNTLDAQAKKIQGDRARLKQEYPAAAR